MPRQEWKTTAMESACLTCRHMREIVSGTGARYLLCRLSQQDSAYAKYPRQPLPECDGYQAAAANLQTLQILPQTLAICRLGPDSPVPEWADGQFVSITRNQHELSIVCDQQSVPNDVCSEQDWRALKISGPLDFSLVGIIASIAGTLAQQQISVFVISTYETDYVLVKQNQLTDAIDALRIAGYEFA